ncbi:MAG: hypothetical protein JWL71_1221 [Acidobacteria bacterium]|nr:hypothetical protein [Acidobacteriota bacterium]
MIGNAKRATFAAQVVFAALAACAFPDAARAGDRYALVITGANGGDAYAQKYAKWRRSFVATLRDKFHYDPERLIVLADVPPRPGAGQTLQPRSGQAGDAAAEGVTPATRENVRAALADLRKRMTKDDQLLVLLIGHGTSLDGEEAKFNLVGPDLSASDWSELLRPLPGRLVFVNTTGASFPFLRKLARKGHVVLTATDTAAQQFETVFPEFFIKAFEDPAADLDRNNRVSMWEAFTYASAGVRQFFEQKGQLPTERPLLDDTGAGVGREAANPGTDGAIARITYLEPDAALTLPADTALAGLMRRRAELETMLEELKARKESTPPDQYDADLEKLLVEIARLSAQIRAKS